MSPEPPRPHTRHEPLARRLEAAFAAGAREAWTEETFNGLALEVFRHQFEHNGPYRALCEHRGAVPERVDHWTGVPSVPARAFQHLDLVCGDAGDVEAVFRTSGTTGDGARRGRHLVPRLSLYRASLLPTFAAHLVVDGDGAARVRLPFVSLIPSPAAAPDSSLSFMVGAAADAYASEVHWLVDDADGVPPGALAARLEGAVEVDAPVLLLGTALAFVHLLETLGARSVPLPSGSRVMETGGFKGSRRAVARHELYARLAGALGLPAGRIVNEYGMTELLSQLYEPVLREGPDAVGHVPPPWLRVRALDPTTLEPLPEGREGLLAFFDLANAGSVAHVLTEDVGAVEHERVRLAGRFPGAEPRGCSRAMDELLSAAAGR